jgi:GNAT superfamily N-acetyltransferase
MNPKHRPYQTEDDFWRMRAFLRRVLVLNDYRERCWHVARLDYARWHTCLNCAGVTLEQVAHLWEQDGEIVAMMMPDGGPGEAHLMVHPDWRSMTLEAEMLALAEERLATPQPDGKRQLVVWADDDDAQRHALLQGCGYVKDEGPEHQWRRRLDEPVTVVPPPDGYTVRPLGDGLELLERCWASGLGFHPDDIQYAVDNRKDVTWYRNIQTAPLYRRDLDLVAVAPDGSIASFATIWFDDVTRSAVFEPVATVPAHQQRGLGKALLTAGLARLQRMGCKVAFVGGYGPRGNALYRSVMGDDCVLNEPWIKTW